MREAVGQREGRRVGGREGRGGREGLRGMERGREGGGECVMK